MARLFSLLALLLLAACHLDELEEFAVARHHVDQPWSGLEAQSITSECQAEQAKLRAAHHYRSTNAQSDQTFLNNCFREIAVMRAAGRR